MTEIHSFEGSPKENMSVLLFSLLFYIYSANCDANSIYKRLNMNGLGKIWPDFIFKTVNAKGLIECGAICSTNQDCNIFAQTEFDPKTTCYLGKLTNQLTPYVNPQPDSRNIFVNQSKLNYYIVIEMLAIDIY